MGNQFMYLYLTLCILQDLTSAMAAVACFPTRFKSKPLTIAVMTGIITVRTTFAEIAATLFPSAADIIYTIKPFVALVVIFVGTFWLLKGSAGKRVLFAFLSMAIDIALELTIGFTLSIVLPSLVFSARDYTAGRVIGTAIFFIVNIPVRFFYAYLWNKFVNKRAMGKSWLLLLVPISQFVTLVGMGLFQYYREISEAQTFVTVVLSFLLCCAADVVFIRFLNKTEKNARLNAELREKEFMYAIEEEHYKNIEERRYEMAKIRHDLANQINTAYALTKSESDDNKEATALPEEVREVLMRTKEYEYCGCAIVNAVIGNKKSICDRNGIAFETDISVGEIHGLSKAHICSIFSNLLDNAINENLYIKDLSKRKITLKAAKSNNYLVVSCQNPISDEKRPKPVSDKKLHGYGLKIIDDIARIYDGRFTTEKNNSIYTATVCVYENENGAELCSQV